MSNDQLQWNLLKEVVKIVIESKNFLLPKYHSNSKLVVPEIEFFATLFLSGKGPAQVVHLILSQKFAAFDGMMMIYGKLCDSDFSFISEPGVVQNMTLGWTRFFEFDGYDDSDASIDPAGLPKFVQKLCSRNCIDHLTLVKNEDPTVDFVVFEACPNLSTLSCPPEVLISLLQRYSAPFFLNLCEIETTESGYANWSLFFEHLKDHPEQCPLLETLTLSANNDDLEALSKLASDYAFPTIKSYNVIMKSDDKPIDFPLIASAYSMFPNLKSTSVTVDGGLEPKKLSESGPTKLSEVYEPFENFNPNVEFTCNYTLQHDYVYYSKTQVDQLETRLRTMGKVKHVLINLCWFVSHRRLEYSVTTSHPSKTLNFTFTIWLSRGYNDGE